MKKCTIRNDLNKLREICKAINALGKDEPSPLREQLREQLQHRRDKLLDKYQKSILALDTMENLIFTLYYLQGMTQREVALKTNYCESSITKHLSFIVEKMK